MATLGAILGPLLASSACDTGAVGVEACREIETARCEARLSCELMAESDLDACKRYSRDNCLHGLAIKKTPDQVEVDACVDAINDISGRTETSATPISDCQYILPLDLTECAFIHPTDETSDTPEPAAEPDSGAETSTSTPG